MSLMSPALAGGLFTSSATQEAHRNIIQPTIPLLDLYLKKTKMPIQKDICTPIFITTLL